MNPPTGKGFDVRLVDDPPVCPRCDTKSLLAVWVPHDLEKTDGGLVDGRGMVLLCETCGSDERYGAALITFFRVHGIVDESNLAEFARLVNTWARQTRVRTVDPEAFQADLAAWYRGEFD
jgi:hypothetical protein